MSSGLNWDGFDDAEFEETESDVDWGGRDGVIFLIDASDEMFESEDGGDSHVQTALKCCHMTMLNKIISSNKDLVGVVLFGTEKMDNKVQAKHITVLQELEQPNIEKIKDLDKMIKSDTLDDFNNKFGHSNQWTLHEALWVCQSLFSGCEMKMGVQRILLLTSCDQPQIGNAAEQQRAIERATDLKSIGISLELLPMGRTFNTNLFYKDLIEAAVGEDYASWALPATEQRLEELLTRCCRYSHKKRTQARILWHLGPDVALGLGIYSMIRKRPMPKSVWMESRENKKVKALRQHVIPARMDDPSVASTSREDHSGLTVMKTLLPMEMVKFQTFGGEKIIFKPYELARLKDLKEPGLYLMGFKPRSAVALEHHFRKPLFLFPDDNQVKGSRKLFAALLERCEAKDRVALCWGVTRRTYPPRLYALFPQTEIVNPETGCQEGPGGFHAFQLPTTENIRRLEIIKMEDETPEQLDHMNKIVSKLTFKYQLHNFRNPKLQTLWAGIEALALELPEARKIEDDTMPKYNQMKKMLKIKEGNNLGTDFEEVFYPDGFDPMAKRKPPPKRAAEGSSGGPRAAKVIKQEDVDVEAVAQSKKVESLKVDQLKAFLQSKGERVTGKKKADLVALVYKVTGVQPPSA